MALSDSKPAGSKPAPSGAARRLLTIPNGISILRVFLAPIVLVMLYQGSLIWFLFALGMMAAAEASDYLDGVIARAQQSVTALGKVIDPMSDAMYHLVLFLGFVSLGWMPVWMVMLLVCRELGNAYLRVFSEQMGVTLAARWSGKAKTLLYAFVQLVVVAMYLPDIDWFVEWRADIAYILLLGVTVVSVLSLLDYLRAVLGPLWDAAE